jgi:hypothetical protein
MHKYKLHEKMNGCLQRECRRWEGEIAKVLEKTTEDDGYIHFLDFSE